MSDVWEIQHEVGAMWQIEYKAKPSVVYATRPHPEGCIFHESKQSFNFTWEDKQIMMSVRK